MTEGHSGCPPPAGTSLRQDLALVTAAATRAVDPGRLIGDRLSLGPSAGCLHCDNEPVRVGDGEPLDLDRVDRIVVIGGGKAAAGFAAGVERLLGAARLQRHRVTGLISVPEGCGRRLARIEVRETRPAGVNLPTAAVVTATQEMLALLATLTADDLAIVLVTGGGSALLEAPVEGISLDLLTRLTGRLATAGGDITTMNTVRRSLSRVKGGGLAAACRADRLLAVLLSDVIGDDLATIASGPCLPAVLDPDRLADLLVQHQVPPADRTTVLRAAAQAPGKTQQPAADRDGCWTTVAGCRIGHLLLGTNATAVAAAAAAAEACGYRVVSAATRTIAETANAVGQRLADQGRDLLAACRQDGQPRAFVEGGEATVVVPAEHGRGGRNQQTVLAAARQGLAAADGWPAGLLLASVGTDGEDGPTDAAGGLCDSRVAEALQERPADLARAVDRCDAYPLLAAAGGLLTTGPTGTNVADLRIILARPTVTNSVGHPPENARRLWK